MVDSRRPAAPALLIAMCNQQFLLRLGLDGKNPGETPLPGGNPRQIRLHDGHFFLAHLADNWTKDRTSRGFLSVLDADLRVISNIAGSAPVYDDASKLRPAAALADATVLFKPPVNKGPAPQHHPLRKMLHPPHLFKLHGKLLHRKSRTSPKSGFLASSPSTPAIATIATIPAIVA